MKDIYLKVIENRVRFKNLHCIVIPDIKAAEEIDKQLLEYSDEYVQMKSYLNKRYKTPALLWREFKNIVAHNSECITYNRKMFQSYDIWQADKDYELDCDSITIIKKDN